jgi:CDGSH iron-sulfur domain-containing protein 3
MGDPIIIAQQTPYVLDMKPGTYYWCQCGRSKTQPFCDGSHTGTDLSPIEVVIKDKGKVAWCGCKHSKKAPFCDGSHSRLES